MRRYASILLALSSASYGITAASAAMRPHYGGVLRVKLRASVRSLDPSEAANDVTAGAQSAKDHLWLLLGDRLVRFDSAGTVRPMLAVSWQHNADASTWEFRLRPGVQWQDGARVDGASAAAALRAIVKGVKVTGTNVSVAFRTDHPMPDLLSILAEARASLISKRTDGSIVGTGAFRLTQWDPGRHAVLAANENYWGGRPFLDGVDVEMGRTPREQIADFELDRADIVELSVADVRRASQRERRLWTSPPAELLALRFLPGRADDPALREALALAIDRQSIYDVLLQRQGEVCASLLPEWISGYAFSFPASPDAARARQLADSLPAASRSLKLDLEGLDPLAHAVADRIAVNARDAGLTLRPAERGTRADLQLVRLRLSSPDPGPALADLTAALGLADTPERDEEARYAAEESLLADHRVIPLAHLPEVYGLGSHVRNWAPIGWTWQIGSVWLERQP